MKNELQSDKQANSTLYIRERTPTPVNTPPVGLEKAASDNSVPVHAKPRRVIRKTSHCIPAYDKVILATDLRQEQLKNYLKLHKNQPQNRINGLETFVLRLIKKVGEQECKTWNKQLRVEGYEMMFTREILEFTYDKNASSELCSYIAGYKKEILKNVFNVCCINDE